MLRRLALACTVLALLSACSSDKANSPPPANGGSVNDVDQGEIKMFFVHESRVDCEGEGPRQCLQVRESEDDDWTLFYSNIEGFEHEEGTRYELRVRVEEVPDPPADSSSLRYVLVEIVSQEKVTSEG